MTSKNYLSNKKNVKISFSTSDALKDWINRYLRAQQIDHPEDQRYKSVSSFIHHTLDSLMKIFEEGKSLEDIDKLVDQEVSNFYDDMTFKAVIPVYENAIQFNKYRNPNEDIIAIFIGYRNFLMKDAIDDNYSDNSLKLMLSRFKKFMMENKLTKNIDAYRDGDQFVFEYTGNYTSIHYENAKSLVAIMGIIGLKIEEAVIIKNYVRLDFSETDIFRNKKLKIKDRISLSNYNVDHYIKFEHIINDTTPHLWIHTSDFKEAIITFIDLKTGINYIESKIVDIPHTERELVLLKLFEHFHWITIEDEKLEVFRFNIPKESHEIEHEIMQELFLGKIQANEDKYTIIH